MKQIYLLSTLLVLVVKTSLCQVIAQDATNSTSLVYQGTTVNVDATQTKASFSINSFANKTFDERSKNFYWGIQATADSKKGLGGILKTGAIVPNADFKLTIGKTWTMDLPKLVSEDSLYRRNQSDLSESSWETAKQINTIENEPWLKLKGYIQDTIIKILNSPPDFILPKLDSLANTKLETYDSVQLRSIIDKIQPIIQKRTKLREKLIPGMEIVRNAIKNYWINRYVLYAIIEGSASKFTLLKNPLQFDYNKRFADTTTQSPRFGIGFNWQRGGSSVFGISATQERSDNFYILKEKEFTITTTDKIKITSEATDPTTSTTSIRVIEGKKTFSGYEGAYKTYWSTAINCDFARFFPGGKSDNATIVWHSYVRQSFSWFKEAFPEVTKIGMGIYAFKDNGTFSGGFYLEVNDVFNNIERLKKEPNFQPAYGRISIGLVTKVALNSIIAFRPYDK